jgi:L-alanine-DL-glutamate epimerase-like enolase superfamily enzyme
MAHQTDIRPVEATLYLLPVKTRVPLKFGPETLTSVTCARVRMRVEDRQGRTAEGWGETPLSVQWTWPSGEAYEPRATALQGFCARLARLWCRLEEWGHPLEVSHTFQEAVLPAELAAFNRQLPSPGKTGPMPWLAALVCASPFDLALHDAFGILHGRPLYTTYTNGWLSRDLASFLTAAEGSGIAFSGRYPAEFLAAKPSTRLKAWHLVGGLDPLEESDLTGQEPSDGHPVLLSDWIRRDGLTCLKVKLRGTDLAWDYQRLIRVGRLACAAGVDWLSADFNCTVREPQYVTEVLDRLRAEVPRVYGMLLYVEQPFAYDLEEARLDVRGVSARKPLFLDESAHDWRCVRLGRELGWTGVALKTCKTQAGAILCGCWARAHGMELMVQDLTNPMLAQIPHAQLAAQVETIMGVETNSMQFYPEASRPEAAIHPGLYQRRGGCLDLSTLSGAGFGYRIEAIDRPLPPAHIREARG